MYHQSHKQNQKLLPNHSFLCEGALGENEGTVIYSQKPGPSVASLVLHQQNALEMTYSITLNRTEPALPSGCYGGFGS